MTRIRSACAMLACAAMPAFAQSAPNIMKPKQVAQRAVEATNVHTAAMTADQGTSTRKAATSSPTSPATVRVPSGAPTATDTAAGSTVVGTPAPRASGFARESFSYDRAGRRDPFVSLMNSGDLRPLISDLRLVAIALDPSGRNSVAILRDIGTKDQYRVRTGQSLGRMRVAQITARSVMFTIEEFGYSRQESLVLGAPNHERAK